MTARSPASMLLVLAVAMRLLTCVRTPVPGRDGATYLWMAQQWQHGRLDAFFDTVFHPLYPFLVGMLLRVWPQLDAVVAGQIVSASCGALAVLPIWRMTQLVFGDRAALWAGFAYAIGTWFVRHPAECLTEGPFFLLVALWALSVLPARPRPALAGLAAGAAYLTRPEGALLVVLALAHLAVRRQWAAALRCALAAGAASALLPLGHTLYGQGFTLTPKGAFVWQVGAGGSDHPLLTYLQNLMRLPGDACEGLGYFVSLLMLVGAVHQRPRRWDDARWLLVLPFLLQCAVIPVLKSHHRFVSGFGVLLLPFAGRAFVALLDRLRARRPWLPWIAIVLLVGSEARLWLDRPTDRTIERDLGRALGLRLGPDEILASDMPRLQFFAGLRPPPPDTIPAADILAIARQPRCRFVVLRRGRTDIDEQDLAALGLRRTTLPPAVVGHPSADAIELFARP